MTALDSVYRRLRGEIAELNETIEECARVVLESGEDKEVCDHLATLIRALKFRGNT